MLKPIPANLQTDFLTETRSDALPTITRDGDTVLYPAFIRAEESTDEGGNVHTEYRFFIVPVPYTGQNIDDEEAFAFASYAALRKHFYGPQEAQSEMKDDNTWEAHRLAVRVAFPKYNGEVIPQIARFEEIKTKFWGLVDSVLAATGKTREDLPPYFNSTTMLEFAEEAKMSADTIRDLTLQFQGINSDLTSNHRNWTELFDNE